MSDDNSEQNKTGRPVLKIPNLPVSLKDLGEEELIGRLSAGQNSTTDLVGPSMKVPKRYKKISKKKGLARIRRRAWEKGSRNESTFYRLLSRLVTLLKEKSPEQIVDGSCRQTGHHNPAKGKIDLEDKRYDVAVSLHLQVSVEEIRKFIFTYDSKSAQFRVNRYNKKRKYRRRELKNGVYLRKAILTAHRTEQDIVSEVLDDFQLVLRDYVTFDKEAILDRFSSV